MFDLVVLIYILLGQVVLMSSELAMRSVCRAIWRTPTFYLVASVFWPVTYLWMRYKWRRKLEGKPY